MGVEALFGNDGNAAILAHLDDVKAAWRVLLHPVLAFELGGDPLYRAFDAERLAAANTRERLLLLEHARRVSGIAEGEPRCEADHFFRAGRLTQAALHASIFGEAQQRPVGIIRQRSGRASRHTRQAERAALDIDLDGAEWRSGGQRDDV